MVKALACVLSSTPGLSAARQRPWASSSNTHTHTHTRTSVAKQYNLVRVKRKRCPAVGKVTVGLAVCHRL